MTRRLEEGNVTNSPQNWRMYRHQLSEALTGAAASVGVAGVGIAASDAPGMMLAGSAIVPLLASGLGEALDRVMSRRERYRAISALAFASDKLTQLLDQGHQIRGDGFFGGSSFEGTRSPGEELIDALITLSMREFEERKIPHLGNLLAHLATSEGIDRSAANRLITLASELSFDQYCLLAVYGSRSRATLRARGYTNDEGRLEAGFGIRIDLLQLLEQTFELWQMNLLMQEMAGGRVSVPHPFNVVPSRMLPFMTGETLVELLELSSIDEFEIERMRRVLGWDGDFEKES